MDYFVQMKWKQPSWKQALMAEVPAAELHSCTPAQLHTCIALASFPAPLHCRMHLSQCPSGPQGSVDT